MRTHTTRSRLFAVGLAAALAVGVGACGGDDDDATEDGDGGVSITQFAFDPQPVEAGSTFTLTNNDDGIEHTMTSDDGAFPEAIVTGVDTVDVAAPTDPGEYLFHCERHTSMTGTLVVE
ncbi:MAG: cupredoxin domain-containing protein [Actinomycetota bacterium]